MRSAAQRAAYALVSGRKSMVVTYCLSTSLIGKTWQRSTFGSRTVNAAPTVAEATWCEKLSLGTLTTAVRWPMVSAFSNTVVVNRTRLSLGQFHQ